MLCGEKVEKRKILGRISLSLGCDYPAEPFRRIIRYPAEPVQGGSAGLFVIRRNQSRGFRRIICYPEEPFQWVGLYKQTILWYVTAYMKDVWHSFHVLMVQVKIIELVGILLMNRRCFEPAFSRWTQTLLGHLPKVIWLSGTRYF